MVKDWGELTGNGITCMTGDDLRNMLYITNSLGQLIEIDQRRKCFERTSYDLHEEMVKTIAVTPNGKIMFTGDCHGHLKQWQVKDMVCLKDFGHVHTSVICLMKITADGGYLFTVDTKGYVIQWKIVSTPADSTTTSNCIFIN